MTGPAGGLGSVPGCLGTNRNLWLTITLRTESLGPCVSLVPPALMWILGHVALLDGLRSSTGIFPHALSRSWACAQNTRVDLSPRPSPILGPGASLPLNSSSWPQPSSGVLVVPWYTSSSGQPRGRQAPSRKPEVTHLGAGAACRAP